MVDQAAFDAVDTCIRHIESCFVRANVKARVWRRFTDEDERHYAYACLTRYSAIGQIMGGGVPEISTVTTSPETGAKIASYLHRVIRDALDGSWPTVIKSHSMSLDSTLYSVVDNDTAKGKTDAMSKLSAQLATNASRYPCLAFLVCRGMSGSYLMKRTSGPSFTLATTLQL
ncbi:hypothetical protein [Acidithrix sp. C25]|uniref:hypothetical protein n=1 Tax=Acidithrix sp. C25 TaxID=1671482 RepID=UPI00191BBDAF|nr:hypothetical protein [Acidithrix sp. C25]